MNTPTILVISLLIGSCQFGFSQCHDASKLDFGGTRLSRSRNHIPFDPKLTDTTRYCCSLDKIRPYADFILSKSEFIVNRAGKNFYNELDVDQIDVNYPDSLSVAYQNQTLYNLANYNVTFWIIYTYTNKKIQYAFGLEFDKGGKMISDQKFPDISKNGNFEHLAAVCDAISVVKNDSRFSGKEVDSIQLSYLDNLNSFCWLVKEKLNPTDCGSTPYVLDHYYVNANTKKLEAVIQKSGVIIVDCATLHKH